MASLIEALNLFESGGLFEWLRALRAAERENGALAGGAFAAFAGAETPGLTGGNRSAARGIGRSAAEDGAGGAAESGVWGIKSAAGSGVGGIVKGAVESGVGSIAKGAVGSGGIVRGAAGRAVAGAFGGGAAVAATDALTGAVQIAERAAGPDGRRTRAAVEKGSPLPSPAYPAYHGGTEETRPLFAAAAGGGNAAAAPEVVYRVSEQPGDIDYDEIIRQIERRLGEAIMCSAEGV